MSFRIGILVLLWLATCVVAGCTAPTGGPAKDASRPGGGAANGVATKGYQPAAGPAVSAAELDELTRSFADRYVGLLSSACDALKKDNPNLVQRSEAQALLANGATNVYDIASNADAFTRVLDLVVVTTLTSQVWIDDDRATAVFGDRAEVLIRALHHGRVEAWALAAQVLRPDQLDLLDYLLWDWRRQNPDMVRVYSVRFSNFAIGSGKSAAAEVLAAVGLAGTIVQAGQAIEEARLLTERMFYQLKREPTLLRWQTEALQDSSLATPAVGQSLADVHRLTDQIEQFPKNVAAEREAIVAAVDERMKRADTTVANIRAAINDVKQLVASVGSTSNSLEDMFKSADSLWMHYDSWDRWSMTTSGARPFDVREYTAGLKELGASTGQLNEVLKSSDKILGNPEWDRRVQQVSDSADERVRRFIAQSQEVENNFFLRSYLALGGLFVALLICLMTAFVLMRRLITRVERNTTELKAVEKQEAVDHGSGPEPGAGGADREGVSP
jgi:hypothetical protein